jgi:CBS domain-containing membrane protein
VKAGWRERVRVVLGGTLGILAAGWLCQSAIASASPSTWPWLVAPLGASAVLVFGAPANPLAQPWAVIGGNTLSALAGIVCVRLGGINASTAAIAVGAAIALMFLLRCLHPPGGASALLVVLTGVTDPAFALYPVLTNSVLLVAVGIAYNRVTRREYPHQPAVAPARTGSAEAAALDADLDAVLARHSHVFDIGRNELKALLEDAHLRSYQRKLANIRCGDLMSRRPITVRPDTVLSDAWRLFGTHRIKALPVIDSRGLVVGIVTRADFVRRDGYQPATGTDQRIDDIMTRNVLTVGVDKHLVDLIPLFRDSGHHHLPIVDAEGLLVGVVTQSDVVAALGRIEASASGPAQDGA